MAINESAMQHAANLESISRSRALFFEADRLNDQAYALLNEPVSTQTIHKFSEAKKRADEKYRHAWQEWLHANHRAHSDSLARAKEHTV